MILKGTITLSKCDCINIKLPEELDFNLVKPKLYIFDVSEETYLTVRFDWISSQAPFTWWKIPIAPGQCYQVLDWQRDDLYLYLRSKVNENLSFFSFNFTPVTLSYELVYED